MTRHNVVAEHVFGTMGTICWTGQMIPQIWKSWHEKSTEGLSQWLVLIWGISSLFLGVYAVLQRLNILLIVQPQLFGFLALLSWGQCQYHGVGRTRKSAIILTLIVMIICGGLEAMLIVVVRPFHDQGNHGAADAFGILSSVLISFGLFPQYWEIYKHKEVIGISLVFMSIDMLGGVFNDLSLVFQKEFDIIAGITYTLVVVLDGIVLLAACILNPVARKRRHREAERQLEAPTSDVPSPSFVSNSTIAAALTPPETVVASRSDSRTSDK